jgi:hypothetical protein
MHYRAQCKKMEFCDVRNGTEKLADLSRYRNELDDYTSRVFKKLKLER